MTWRNSPLLRKRSQITELIDSLLADDIDAIAGLLAKFPSLAHEPLTLGATRQESVDYFIDEIGHYIYSGDTALHIAAMTYCVDAVAMLCEHGADVAARNRRGAQPLHYACDGSPNAPTWNPTRQGATVARLIDLGADPNALDKSGVAPIHRAEGIDRRRCQCQFEKQEWHRPNSPCPANNRSRRLRHRRNKTRAGSSHPIAARSRSPRGELT